MTIFGTAASTAAEAVIDASLAAYGREDLTGLEACLAPDVTILLADSGQLINGRESVLAAYNRAFRAFPLSGTTRLARIALGGVVIDHEVSTRSDAVQRELATLYRVNTEGHIIGVEVMNAGPEGIATRASVERQLAAYNAQDLDEHCSCFADAVTVANIGEAANLSGIDAYRARYAGLFAQFPNNHAELVDRIVVGAWAIDHERVRRDPVAAEPAPFEVLAIYHVVADRIQSVRFVR